MFGWDESDINQNRPTEPLADMTFDQWWFHGYRDIKPAKGVFMELVSFWTPRIFRRSVDVFMCHSRPVASFKEKW